MYCVVFTFAQSLNPHCDAVTNIIGPFNTLDQAEQEMDNLRGVYRDKVLYLRSFCLCNPANCSTEEAGLPRFSTLEN